MRVLYTFAILVLSTCLSMGQTVQPSLVDIAGEYLATSGPAGLTGYKLTLKADGTYSRKHFTDDGDDTPAGEGKYSLNDYVVSFEPAKGEGFKLYVIRWDGRAYLAAEVSRFVAAVNIGLEPRPDSYPQDNLEYSIYLRRDDGKVTPTGMPVTVKAADELLNAPRIEVRVTSEQLDGQTLYVDVNKGSADGVRVSMCFFPKRERNVYDPVLCVTSLTDHLATLTDTDPWSSKLGISAGDTLTNRLRGTGTGPAKSNPITESKFNKALERSHSATPTVYRRIQITTTNGVETQNELWEYGGEGSSRYISTRKKADREETWGMITLGYKTYYLWKGNWHDRPEPSSGGVGMGTGGFGGFDDEPRVLSIEYQDLGQEQINGVKTTHYRKTVHAKTTARGTPLTPQTVEDYWFGPDGRLIRQIYEDTDSHQKTIANLEYPHAIVVKAPRLN